MHRLLLVLLPCAAFAADAGIEKIAVYAGTWNTVTEHFATPYSQPGKETTTLHNDCWRSAGFYACSQVVDGDSKALIVFTYDDKTDTFSTYPIPAHGEDASRGKLIIKDNVWTYPWESTQNGKTTYFQVVNVFTSPRTIEFRQEFSDDKVHWTVMVKGTEKKQ